MSSRILRASIILFVAAPAAAAAQSYGGPPVLAPSLSATALFPARSVTVYAGENMPETLVRQSADGGLGPSFLVRATVLAAASLGGLWAGRQVPFSAIDDDSDLGMGHLVTSPVASMAAVAAASTLLGTKPSSSLRGTLIGGAAGLGAALVASLVTTDTGIALSYAGVHGLITALATR